MNFTWHFGQIKGNNYSFPLPGLSNITVQYFAEKGFGPVVIFANKLLVLNQTYIMKLVVTKDYRASSVFQVIRLQNEEPPRVSQRYIFRRYSNLNLFCCSRNSNWHWLSISHRPDRRDVLLNWRSKCDGVYNIYCQRMRGSASFFRTLQGIFSGWRDKERVVPRFIRANYPAPLDCFRVSVDILSN